MLGLLGQLTKTRHLLWSSHAAGASSAPPFPGPCCSQSLPPPRIWGESKYKKPTEFQIRSFTQHRKEQQHWDDSPQSVWITIFESLKEDFSSSCAVLSYSICLALWDPMDCSPPGSSVHGILQARIPEWVAMSSSSWSSQLWGWTQVSYVSCIGRQFHYHYHHLGCPIYLFLC